MNRALVALGFAAVCLLAQPASAEIITLHGMWTDRPASKNSSQKVSAPSLLGGSSASLGAASKPKAGKPVALASGGPKPSVKARQPALVEISNGTLAANYGTGNIVIDTARRRLYYVISPTMAYSYPVAVGKQGFTWTGTQTVSKVVHWPDWMPPEEMRERKPNLPVKMTGGVQNPLGARAIYLGSTLYRIHGTNDPGSIGSASSSGCFRMHNGHVAHLAKLVTPQSTKVHVLKSLPKSVVAAGPAAKPASQSRTAGGPPKRT